MANYKLHHLHLISSDALKTAEFYEKYFGAKSVNVSKTPDGRTGVELDLGGGKMSIAQRWQPVVPGPVFNSGIEHFGIQTDDIEASVARLKADGIKFRDEIRQARPGVRIAYFWAPENVLIELIETKG